MNYQEQYPDWYQIAHNNGSNCDNEKYSCQFLNWPITGGLRTGPDQQEFYAKMASVAYGNTPEGRADKMTQFNLNNDWIQDNDLSNPDISILVNSKTKEVVSSVTGTRITSKKHRFRDLRSDLGIVFGVDKLGSRNSEVKDVVQQARQKYSGYDHTLTGHSLGGKVASNLSKTLDIPAVVFNKGSSPLGAVTNKIMSWFNDDKKKGNVIHYTTNDLSKGNVDLISLSAALLDPDKKKIVDQKYDAHDLKNFTGEGKKRKKKRKKIKRSDERYSMLEKGNAIYPRGMISNQVLPRWHESGIKFVRAINS